jgi:Nif-specific regulatory protein
MKKQFQLSEKEFLFLSEVSSSLHTIRDLDEMFLAIFDNITTLFDIQGASIALHDRASKEFYFIRTVDKGLGHANSRELSLRFPDHMGVAGWVLANNRPARIKDVTQDARFYHGMDGKEDFTTSSMICVPLRTRGGFLGVLYALNKINGEFSEKEEKILEILSGTIAGSLENAMFYGELKDHLDKLEREKKQLLLQLRGESGFSGIIGSSPPMRHLFELMEKVIDSSTTVLIQGETGTGKELIARVIHFNGPLKEKPFVAENCAALTESLMESELFGHVQGAFTGAVKNKKGLFEIADGGTIFLDEIGEMSPQMQVKLLRVLQEGEFRPVGGRQPLRVNVRVIAATNKDLEKEVHVGRFREDLYYRINVFQITPPTLRARKEDIPLLAHHFLKKYARKNNRNAPNMCPHAIDFLVRFDWPGNVRELENEIERALTMAGGSSTITEEMLSLKIRRIAHDSANESYRDSSETLKDLVGRVEGTKIREALAAAGGNRSRAAKKLGLSRQGLHNKIAAYKIVVK